MNCIYQKAVSDNVMFNKCGLDNVLWFHLECPKWIDFWDNPNYFKVRMRNYINEKIIGDLKNQPTGDQKHNAFEFNQTLYPED